MSCWFRHQIHFFKIGSLNDAWFFIFQASLAVPYFPIPSYLVEPHDIEAQ